MSFRRQFDVQSPGGEELPQQLFDAELGDDENAGIRPIGRGVAAFVYIEVAKDRGAIVAAEGKMEASVGEDLVDDSQVIEEFETAGLQALASRAGKEGGGLVDDAEVDSAAGQVTGQGESGGSCAYYQDGEFGAGLVKSWQWGRQLCS